MNSLLKAVGMAIITGIATTYTIRYLDDRGTAHLLKVREKVAALKPKIPTFVGGSEVDIVPGQGTSDIAYNEMLVPGGKP